MNKTTLIIVIIILGFIVLAGLIHYEMEQTREKNAETAAKVIKDEIPDIMRKTADKIPDLVRKTGDAISNGNSRQAPAAEQPARRDAAAKNSTSQQDNSGQSAKDDSHYKSPVGAIFDLGTAVVRETDKAAQQFLPPVTSSEEQQIGAEINRMILVKTPEWKDPALVKTASNIFIKLLPLANRKDISYRLTVLDDKKVINAYAVPGGYIYITRALLERFNSEPAIAMCLSHEIGHVELHHTTDRLRPMMAARKIVGSDIAMIAQAGYQMLTNCYTKEQEFDADEFGFRISLKTGISREKMLAFLDGLSDLEKEMREKSGTAESADMPVLLRDMEYFMQSHPYTTERLERLKKIQP